MKINKENIIIDCSFNNKTEAIKFIGLELLNRGLIHKEYIDSMIERDKKHSVAIGNFIAIPHGEYESKKYILKNGILIIKLKEVLLWDEQEVKVIIALALAGDDQLEMLQSIGVAFSDEQEVNKVYSFKTIDEIYNYFLNIDL